MTRWPGWLAFQALSTGVSQEMSSEPIANVIGPIPLVSEDDPPDALDAAPDAGVQPASETTAATVTARHAAAAARAPVKRAIAPPHHRSVASIQLCHTCLLCTDVIQMSTTYT